MVELRAEVDRESAQWLRSLIDRPLNVLAESGGTGHAENFARVALPQGTPPGTILEITPAMLDGSLLK